MSDVFGAPVARWLQASKVGEPGMYRLEFDRKFFGNPFIRSIHGGVTAALMEITAQAETQNQPEVTGPVWVLTNSIDYLRITKDKDLFARARIQRLSRRLSIVEVSCWQDSEEMPIARGVVTLKIEATKALVN